MNIHHLELFYYVAKHGGISEAVRNMPYGIQQPAMSSQIIQLEEFLGVTLFRRRPFELTLAGAELYEFIMPFFDNLGAMADKLRGGMAQHLRIGASEIVLRDHLPALLQSMKRQFPKLKVTLRQAYQPSLESLVMRQDIDLAITLLEGKPPAGLQVRPLLELPLVLLVPASSPIRSAADLWELDRIEESLITLPANESISRNFQKGLARNGVDWFGSVEVSTLELVEVYVAHGYGIGLSVARPQVAPRKGVRILPLEDFPPVTFGVLWQGKPTPVMKAFLKTVEAAVKEIEGA